MNKEEIYSKLEHFCLAQPHCIDCLIKSINPKHKCGSGYSYLLHRHPVPLSEALKYYTAICGKHDLRDAIEKRKENDRYERRV